MPLGTVWAFPSKTIPEPTRLETMKNLAEKIARLLRGCKLCAHPVELSHALEPEALKLAVATRRSLKLAEPVPKLCTVVVFSAFDAALHDAYGKVHGRHVYDCYGAEWMNDDLARYLEASFAGEHLDGYSLRRPKPRMPLYHLIGALDALTDADVKERHPPSRQKQIPISYRAVASHRTRSPMTSVKSAGLFPSRALETMWRVR
jgi:hypothetical protein